MKRRYFPSDINWTIEEASVLNEDYCMQLGGFDIVPSWGVLYHTGAMWRALEIVSKAAKPGEVYGSQSTTIKIKKAYNTKPGFLRWLVLWPALIRLWSLTSIRDVLTGATLSIGSRTTVRGYQPGSDIQFFKQRSFQLERMGTCGGGLGCNEFVFLQS